VVARACRFGHFWFGWCQSVFLTSDQLGNLCVACGEHTYTQGGPEHQILGIMLVDFFLLDCPFHLLCYMSIFFFIDEKKMLFVTQFLGVKMNDFVLLPVTAQTNSPHCGCLPSSNNSAAVNN